MSSEHKSAQARLTSYEDEQVRQIAAWKSLPPNPFSEMFKMVTLPGARVVEQVVPDQIVRTAIERSYDVSDLLAGQKDIKRQASVSDLTELKSRPLEECDKLANVVSAGSQVFTAVEGAATGAGGPLTTLIDIPILFVASLRTIIKIGHCYGYPLDQPRDKRYVMGVLLASTSNSLEVRRERLHRLREIEDWLIEEAQQDIVAEEVASFLFQLEIFEEIPGVGAVSGALLNLAFIRRVDITARRVFQERWLRDNGKVDRIAPAEAHARALATGWGGALSRAAYQTCYYLGYGATLPAWYVASLILPRGDNVLTQGVRDGAAAATSGADRTLSWVRGAAGAPSDGAPALAHA